jgi:putative ABC transport system permease protein
MHEDIHPMAMHFMPGNWEGYILVRIGEGNVHATVDYIRQVWEDFNTEYPFDYTWMDDEFNQLFDPERRTSNILLVFSILCIFISCLGLLGLISYSTVQRTREIGIRKTFGASASIIISMLSRETVRLMGIASILSVPAYFAVHRWLQNFAYHIPFNPWLFFLALLMVAFFILLIALLTVSYQSYKAASANPADSLRVE